MTVQAVAHGGAMRSLHNRNFRLYLTGQGASAIGTWFQQTAEIWLIFQLTGSGAAVGLHQALRFGPLLLIGIPAGLLTDRFDHRKLLIATQVVYAVAATILTIVAFGATPSLYLIYAMVLVQGIVNAVDNPLRRSFVRDLVSDADIPNAVSLNSTVNTVSRTIGPALAGLLIVAVGVPWCFAINALSFAAVLASLFLIDKRGLRVIRRAGRAGGQLQEGFRYAWSNRRIRTTMIMVFVMGLFAWNWNTILPLYATATFHGDASLYGLMMGVMGGGAFVGSLLVARLDRITGKFFRTTGALLGIALVSVAVAPVLPLAIAALAVAGGAATVFQIGAQTRLQLETDDAMTGRILALYSVGFIGTKPIGGLIAGWLVDLYDPRVAFLASAGVIGALVATLFIRRAMRRAGAESTAIIARPVGIDGSGDILAQAEV